VPHGDNMRRSGKVNIEKPEKILTLKTVSTQHFIGAIVEGDDERVALTGLAGNNITILGVNGQSIQNLKYLLYFFGDSSYDSSNIDVDSYKSDVLMDFSDDLWAHQINFTGQWRLDLSGIEIPINTTNYTLYMSLQNLSTTSKIAGSLGAVQFDIKYSLRN